MKIVLYLSKVIRFSVAVLFALFYIAGCDKNNFKIDPSPSLDDEMSADQEFACTDYSFELDATNPSGEVDFVVLCNGVKVYSTMNDFAGDFSFINVDRNGTQRPADPRTVTNSVWLKDIQNDIDNDGIPELFLVSDDDSRNGTRHAILLLGPVFRQVEYRDYDETLFVDVDKTGSLEIVTRDYGVIKGIGNSDGWSTNLEPPWVLLSVRGGSFTFSEKVRKEFDLKRFQSMTNNRSKIIDAEEDIPDKVGSYMLELIYQGEGRRAFDYFDRVTANAGDDTKLMYENWLTLSLINSATFFEPAMTFNGWKYIQPQGEAACPEGADRYRFIKVD